MIDRVPLPKTESTPQEEAKGHQGEWTGGLDHMDDMNYHRLADLLEVEYEERRDSNIASKINYLTEWAKEHTKSTDRLIHAQAIKELARGLGYAEKGKTLLIKLYQYTRLDSQRQRLEQEMELLK